MESRCTGAACPPPLPMEVANYFRSSEGEARPAGGDDGRASGSGEADEAIALITTVELSPDCTTTLVVYENDDVNSVAGEFCATHGLPDCIREALALHLAEHVRQQAPTGREESTGSTEVGAPPHAAYLSSCGHHTTSPQHESATTGPLETTGSCRTLWPGAEHDVDVPDVFSRLYSLAKQREEKAQLRQRALEAADHAALKNPTKASRKRSTSAKQPHHDVANYGEYLYREGVSSMRRRQQLAEQARLEAEEEELRQATFRPEITLRAQELSLTCYRPSWALLTAAKSHFRVQKRLAQLRDQEEAAFVATCTFKPKINPQSSSLRRPPSQPEGSGGGGTYELLYLDAQRRQAKQRASEARGPDAAAFHPRLLTRERPAGTAPQSHSGTAERHSEGGRPAERACDRLYAHHQTQQARRLQKQQEELRDEATGRPLFQPKTCRRPQHGTRACAPPRSSSGRATQPPAGGDAGQPGQLRPPGLNSRSCAIHAELQHRRLDEIFDCLDVAGGARLDLLGIVLGGAGSEQLADMCPDIRADLEAAALIHVAAADPRVDASPATLLDTHKRSNEVARLGMFLASMGPEARGSAVVDVDGFHRVMEAVFARRRGLPRAYLRPESHLVHTLSDGPTFQPVINLRSAVLARTTGRAGRRRVHEQLHEQAKARHALAVRRAEARRESTMAACTFRPTLVASQLVNSGKALKLAASRASCISREEPFTVEALPP